MRATEPATEFFNSEKQLLIITGTPRTGKTTISRSLIRLARKRGRKGMYVAITGFHYLIYLLALLACIVMRGKTCINAVKIKVHPLTVIGNCNVVRIFLRLELLNIYVTLLFKIFIPLKFCDFIVVDEGPINLLTNYIDTFARCNSERGLTRLIYESLRLFSLAMEKAEVRVFEVPERTFTKELRTKAVEFVGDFNYKNYLKTYSMSKKIFEGWLGRKVEQVTALIEYMRTMYDG